MSIFVRRKDTGLPMRLENDDLRLHAGAAFVLCWCVADELLPCVLT
jgi:hypothetical protein